MNDAPNIPMLRAATGISKSYASEILSGKRQPAPSLAIKIYRETGHKFPPIVDLPDDKIDALERMIGEVAGMLGSAA
jgi:transcriptional regulator with XRE-family HTH domain